LEDDLGNRMCSGEVEEVDKGNDDAFRVKVRNEKIDSGEVWM
jgi:hypothetical protein